MSKRLIYFTFSLILIFSCLSTTAQKRDFFDDVVSSRLSLCFKGYILVDNSLLKTKDMHGATKQTFLKSDSSQFVVIRLMRKFPSSTTDDEPTAISRDKHINNSKKNPLKRVMNDKMLRKFGASYGFFAANLGSNTPGQGYTYKSGIYISQQNLGIATLEVYERNDSPEKRFTGKDFINFASGFIQFNNR